MPQFNDSENKLLASKPGDYILRVLSYDKKLSKGQKTGGSEMFEMKLGVEQNGAVVSELFDNLIDHPSCHWRWDVFLKSCGVKIAKGENFSFDRDDAAQQNIRHIEIRGLRGWGTIAMKKPQHVGDVPKFNEVVAWITNKEKLTPIERQVEPEDDSSEIPF